MKRLTSAYIAILTAALALTSCHSIPEYENTGKGNFEQLWTLFDEHYCFFEESGVDWDSVYRAYAPRVESCRTQRELFRLCADMVNELRDGHVNLASPFATSYYMKLAYCTPLNKFVHVTILSNFIQICNDIS